MKTSALIARLQELVDMYGDLPVQFYGDSGTENATPSIILAYDEDGNTKKERVQIYIHGH